MKQPEKLAKDGQPVPEAQPAMLGSGPEPFDPFPSPELDHARFLLPQVSGLYSYSFYIPGVDIITERPFPIHDPGPLKPSPLAASAFAKPGHWLTMEVMRLDVDGRYPLMAASGNILVLHGDATHWIAELTASAAYTWTGPIWYKDGDTTAFPYTNVTIQVNKTWLSANRLATVTFSGGGIADRVRTFTYTSPFFHKAEFEYDSAEGTTAVTTMNTGDHPNHLATLVHENLTIEKVYQRAGFDVANPNGQSIVPMTMSGADPKWTDTECHDAMQSYWSHFSNAPLWSIWVFFAAEHVDLIYYGVTYEIGGIMFDDIGPNHRQGTAIFEDSFISEAPAGDTNPTAWVERNRFWTAMHEMGHCFNLAHSWQKTLDDPGPSWIPLSDDSESRSIMNYPQNVAGGQSAYYANFAYRFTDDELLFLRHAPDRFVQPGNADWFDNHGFLQPDSPTQAKFRLEVRANRVKPEYEFLEPVVLELKLVNITNRPQVVAENLISNAGNLKVILKKKGKPAREYKPYARYEEFAGVKVLMSGEAMYAPLTPYAGLNGMDLAEPGYYSIQVGLHLPDSAEVVSNPFRLRITPPASYDEEYLAQDFFEDEVGRILSFGGSRVLTAGINTLQEIAERLYPHKVAVHARLALANPTMREFKTLVIPAGVTTRQALLKAGGAKITAIPPRPDIAVKEMRDILIGHAGVASESLGHIQYRSVTERLAGFLAEQKEYAEAAEIEKRLYDCLAERNVSKSVLAEIKHKETLYERSAKAR